MTTPITAEKNILGYTLKERIGSGGFGEVWSAVAPGGIMKAVKVVYGFHNEKHAMAEIKALDRVKELRHPFLLSLERIEIYEGQLIVVTELADKSLADNFNEYIIKGEPGIPRDVLIKYMRNTAEALDYMSDEHGLQHLDIKPENLLVIGGHVKVADFGLAKDLQNTNQSLMSGMTPAYAAPELFDGRPGANSDQYSLAIVYQEMLTGVKPFPGTTPAQLAAQHMHGRPNLRPLDKHDQLVIAKALTKNPENRFSNCVQMIEELSNKKRAVKKAIRRTQTVRENADTEVPTACFGNNGGTAVISNSALPFQAAEIKMLGTPECDAENATVRPTLIVTVGATANKIAQKIKSRLANRHGSMNFLPSVQVMCVDTDRQDLSDLQRTEGAGRLSPSEIIETSLRKPEAYRARGRQHLKWLSRRWIYNVPRSLQTEGLRPLGRLAFADHFENICDRLQGSINEITKEENLGTTAESLGINPGSKNPRVFLISSISGGVGSGMSIDLAYTIKLLLHESGLKSDCLTGLFLHSTYQRNRDPGLSAANAFAFLTELRHFTEHGFPGDETIGLPEFEEEAPMDFTYFNDLGNDLPVSKFEEKLDKVAEYVYLSAFSKSSTFFDSCRALDEEIDHLALRTFGLSATGPGTGTNESGEPAAHAVQRNLLLRWLHGDTTGEFDPAMESDKILAELQLGPDQVTLQIAEKADTVFDHSFNEVADQLVENCQSNNSNYAKNLSAYLDGVLGFDTEESPDSVLQMEELVDRSSAESANKLQQAIMEIMNGSSMNLAEARETANHTWEKLNRIQEQIRYRIGEWDQSVASQANLIREIEAAQGSADFKKDLKLALSDYCDHRFKLFVNYFVSRYYKSTIGSLDSAKILLKQYFDQINAVASPFTGNDELESVIDSMDLDIGSMMGSSIAQDAAKHIAQTELQVYESFVKPCGGYIGMFNQTGRVQDELGDVISVAARQVVADANKKISMDKVILENGLAQEQMATWFNHTLKDAQPQVHQCGGSARLLIGMPGEPGSRFVPDAIENQAGVKGFSFYGTNGCLVVCFEGEDVPMANVAYRLLEARPDAIEIVKRIHTRSDIEWTSLHDLL